MRTSVLILLFALLAVAVNAGKFKQRHGELKGLQSIFYRLDRRLTNQISRAKRQINSARVRRNRHHAARRRAHTQLKVARSKRLAAEVKYNAARKTEEQKLRSFRAAHKVYLNSKRNYNRVYKSKTQDIREWDHERSVIEQVRKLLGVNHSKNWKKYRKDGGVRYQGKKHQKYKHVGTHFHQGRKRFLQKNLKTTLKGTADDYLWVYKNGKRIAYSAGWTAVKTVTVKSRSADVFAFKCKNHGRYHGGNPGGFRMQVARGGRNYYSNPTWRCKRYTGAKDLKLTASQVRRLPRSRVPPFNWNKHNKLRTMSQRAKWIWTKNNKVLNVVCYFVVPN